MKNILFITADQLRYDTLGFQGVFPVKTPNIDRLARRGTVFDNAYCANPLCVPARASIMTGKYSYDTGVYYNGGEWDEALKTIPGELAANGYYTVAAGKMHFLPKAAHRGFHKRMADPGLHYKDYLRRKGYLDQLQSEFKPAGDGTPHCDEIIEWVYSKPPTQLRREDFITPYIASEAIHELDLISRRRECLPGGNEPFFMWLSFTKPHQPSDPPEPYYSMYDPDEIPGPVRGEHEPEQFPRQLKRFRRNWDILDDDLVRKNRARYLGNVTLLDEEIGRVLDKLDALGLGENTLIILSADHGDHLGDHHLQQKGFYFEPSVKVPLIFCGPGIPAGVRIQENVSHIDLLPTVLDYCQLTQPLHRDPAGDIIYRYADFGDARSLMPAFHDGRSLDAHRIVLAEAGIHGLHIMLKRGNEKINYYHDTGEIERYYLDKDPDELNNTGQGVTLDGLPEDVRCRLRDVLHRIKPYESGYYWCGGRVRPMFT